MYIWIADRGRPQAICATQTLNLNPGTLNPSLQRVLS